MPVIEVEVDEQTQGRLAKLAPERGCSSLEVVQVAIRNHLQTEAEYEASLREDDERWQRYLQTGRTVANDRVLAWLDTEGSSSEMSWPQPE